MSERNIFDDRIRCTLYVNNLNDRVHVDALQRKLIPRFERFGKLLDVVAMKSVFRRGQMFIVFANPAAALKAMETLQNEVVFGKPMKIDFARTVSDALLNHQRETITRVKKPLSTAQESQRRIDLIRVTKKKSLTQFIAPPPVMRGPSLTPPNKTLFVENLPVDFSISEFNEIFSGFPGFLSARLIAVRSVGFVDFGAEFHATAALAAVNGRALRGDYKLIVSYAKR